MDTKTEAETAANLHGKRRRGIYSLDTLFDEVSRAAKEAREAQARHAAALDNLERELLLRELLTK